MTSHLRHIATEPANLNDKILHLDRSPKLHQRSHSQLHASDSKYLWKENYGFGIDANVEGSIGTGSLSHDSQPEKSPIKLSPGICPSPRSISSLQEQLPQRRNAFKGEWEILEGLREGQRCEENPDRYEGFLLKRRKWPLKGWHKRYFIMDNGILVYAKNPSEMAREKIHGSIDVGLSVISTKTRGRRIDIDADECIYHLKVKTREQFGDWVQRLRHHRLYRQHEIAFGNRDSAKALSPVEDVPLPLSPVLAMCQSDLVQSFAQRAAQSPSRMNNSYQQGKVSSWLNEFTTLEELNKDLNNIQQTIFQLSSLFDQLKQVAISASTSSVEISEIGTTNTKKDRKRFLLGGRKKISKVNSTDFSSKVITVDKISNKDIDVRIPSVNTSSINIHEMVHLSTSNPNLSTSDEKFRPHSLPEPSQLYDGGLAEQNQPKEFKIHEEFLSLAKDVHSSLRSAYWSIQGEKERLRQTLESNDNHSNSQTNVVTNLKTSLKQVSGQVFPGKTFIHYYPHSFRHSVMRYTRADYSNALT